MDLATAPRSIYPLVPLKLADFRYEFPRKLVAKYPVEPRHAARMLVVHRDEGRLEHRTFADLPEYFGEGDALVTNDTQVFPARLYGRKEGNGARVEVFLLRELNASEGLWDVLVEPARKIRVGNKLFFGDHLAAEVIDNTTSRGRTVRFIYEGTPEDFYGLVDEIGVTPIPPYLRRDEEPEDADRYQTMFAQKRGAVAAPTAGLHFTPELVERIEAQGATVCSITLHTGLGSFQPVEVEDLGKHRMDLEYFEVPPETCGPVNHALSTRGCTVTACGTTVVRAMESSLSAMKQLKADSGWTDKFIYPPHDFLIADRLITNFHRPCSTLLMMISAFAGHELMQHAYQEAIKEEYRLFSFGDGMLIV